MNKGRRRFLIAGALTGGGLIIGGGYALRWDKLGSPDLLPVDGDEVALNAWLKIAADGAVTVAVPRAEMGQGIYTALAMLVAEELRADWNTIGIEMSPSATAAVYGNSILFETLLPTAHSDNARLAGASRFLGRRIATKLGLQITGGSTSCRDAWEPMRVAGAAAREMLIAAASDRLSVPRGQLRAEAGFVHHVDTGQRLGFGELAGAAARISPPGEPALTDPADYRYIGKPVPRLDIPDKVTGRTQFGIDVRLPGMLYAAVGHVPNFGGTISKIDEGTARDLPGVVEVAAVPNGVAVIADSYWRAKKGLAALRLTIEAGPTASMSSASLRESFLQRLDGEAHAFEDEGDSDSALAAAGTVLEADYEVPYLAHACMEPMNCTARITAGACEIWVPNQSATMIVNNAARVLDIDKDAVTVHNTYLGGGFGRRVETDVLHEALACAQAVPGRAVKVIWSREEDIQHDTYRPMAIGRFKVGLDAGGNISAFQMRVAGQGVGRDSMRRNMPDLASDAPDAGDMEGALRLSYGFGSRRIEHARIDLPVPVGYWRSVGHSYTAYFVECMIDEAAAAAGVDPVAYRLRLLRGDPRGAKVLRLAARYAGWDRPLGPNRARGIAYAPSFGSLVAQVVEITLEGGELAVDRVVSVVDCGTVINPDTAIAQVEGGIIFGLTAALYGNINIEQGRVRNGNFPDYPLMGLRETPAFETYLVESGAALGGIGEVGTPPAPAALANALFAATGQPVRRLPVSIA